MSSLNKAWIDVTTMPDGSVARGCRPRFDPLGSQFPVFEDSLDVISRSDWGDLHRDDVSTELMVRKIKNQGREGTCASNATASAFEIIWNMTMGPTHWIEMSPISIYRWIAPGPGTGSYISDNLRQLREVGLLPVNTDDNRNVLEAAGMDSDHVLTATGYYQQFPDGWKETAKHFRGLEWFDLRSFDGLITALFLDMPVVYGRAGHAICGVTPHLYRNVWHIKYANSWGDWGDQGYGYDSEGYVSNAISSYGAFALRAVHLPEALLAV